MRIKNWAGTWSQAIPAMAMLWAGSINWVDAQEVYVKKDNFSGITQFLTENRLAKYFDGHLNAARAAGNTKRCFRALRMFELVSRMADEDCPVEVTAFK